jgi:hypothetical protein
MNHIKNELEQVYIVLIVIAIHYFNNGADEIMFGMIYAFIAIFSLRILYINFKLKSKEKLFYRNILNIYILISLALSFVFYDQLTTIALSFLVTAFLYSVFLNLITKSKYSFYDNVKSKINMKKL